jgi:hypothetical protein
MAFSPDGPSVIDVAMRVLLLCVCLLSSGCFFNRGVVNRPIDPLGIAKLEPGKSTAADVTAILGAPVNVVQLGRRSAYLYEHVQEKQSAFFIIILTLRGVDRQEDRCWVFFDEENVLTHVASTLQASTSEYNVPPFSFSTDPE